MIEIVVWLSLAVQSSVIITRDRPTPRQAGALGRTNWSGDGGGEVAGWHVIYVDNQSKVLAIQLQITSAQSGCWLAGPGWVGGTCHTRQISRITQAGPPRNSRAGIKEIIPGSYSQSTHQIPGWLHFRWWEQGTLLDIKELPLSSFQL